MNVRESVIALPNSLLAPTTSQLFGLSLWLRDSVVQQRLRKLWPIVFCCCCFWFWFECMTSSEQQPSKCYSLMMWVPKCQTNDRPCVLNGVMIELREYVCRCGGNIKCRFYSDLQSRCELWHAHRKQQKSHHIPCIYVKNVNHFFSAKKMGVEPKCSDSRPLLVPLVLVLTFSSFAAIFYHCRA